MVIGDAAVCIYTVHEGRLFKKKMQTCTSCIYLQFNKHTCTAISRGWSWADPEGGDGVLTPLENHKLLYVSLEILVRIALRGIR